MEETMNIGHLEMVFSEAYKEYYKGLLTHACFRLSDRAVGEDLVQDTFIKMWNYISKGGKIETMKAFLYHILNNLIIDQYRKHKTMSLEKLIEKGYEPSEDLSERMINVLDGKKILPLIKNLPDKYQKIIYMRYTEGLSPKEMSFLTRESTNTIAVQVHRGIKKLKLLV